MNQLIGHQPNCRNCQAAEVVPISMIPTTTGHEIQVVMVVCDCGVARPWPATLWDVITDDAKDKIRLNLESQGYWLEEPSGTS